VLFFDQGRAQGSANQQLRWQPTSAVVPIDELGRATSFSPTSETLPLDGQQRTRSGDTLASWSLAINWRLPGGPASCPRSGWRHLRARP